MEAKENDVKARGYLNESFKVFHNTDILGTDTPVHFHTFYKVTFVKYGRGSYMIDGRVYDIGSGDVILVGINVPHRPDFEKGELYDRYTLYISEGMLESFDIPECHITELFSSESANVIRPDRKEADRFISLMERIDTESRSSSYGAVLSARLLVIRFLIEAARCREESSLTVPLKNEDDRMLSVLRYVNENLSNSLSVKETASHFEMESEALNTSFKESFGCEIGEYMINRRLSKARQMILQGTGPAEACYECGYKSYPDFTKDYQNKYGSLPKLMTKEPGSDDGFSDYFPE